MHTQFTTEQIERFWSRVDKTTTPDGCWEWQGNIANTGYGRYGQKTAHRMSYEIIFGDIPNGLMICHRCANRRCVRPDHIYAGTAADNARDMIESGCETQCLTKNKNAKRGSGNVLAKLTDEKVIEIRRLYETGDYTMSEIGRMFGIRNTNVHHIVHRRTWTHI